MSRICKIPFAVVALTFAMSFPSSATNDISVLVDRAQSLLSEKRYDDARHELLCLKEITPKSDKDVIAFVAYGLSVCALAVDTSTPADAMVEFLDKYPQSVYGNDIRFRLGCLFCEREQYEMSSKYFSQVIKQNLNDEDLEKYHMQYGYAMFKLNSMSEAYALLSCIPFSSRYYDHSVYFRAYIDYELGKYDSAKRGFNLLLQSSQYAELVPYYILQIEFASGNYDYVSREGRTVALNTVEEKKVDVYRILAESFFRTEDYRLACIYINRYRDLNGVMEREEYYILGYSLYRLADYSMSALALRKVASGDDSLAQNAAYHLADCYVRLGDTRSAVSSFAMASSLDFDSKIKEESMFNYGKLLFETNSGKFNEAVNVLAKYVASYPQSNHIIEAKALLVAAYYNSRDYDMAYNAISKIEQPNASVRLARQKITIFKALDEFRDGRMDEALRLLDESSKIGVSPKYNALAAYWRAEIAYRKENMEEAVENYNYFIRRAPKNGNEYALAQYGLGYSYLRLGRYNRSVAAFKSFTDVYQKRDSLLSDAFNRIGDVFYLKREYPQALDFYRRSRGFNSQGKYYAQYFSALTLGLLDRNSEKEQELSSIISSKEGEYVDDAHYELGRMYVSQKRYNEAVLSLSDFTSMHPSSPFTNRAIMNLGLSYFNIGKTNESLGCYDSIISTSPHSEDAKNAMQCIREIYVSRGDAESYFKYASQSNVECDLSAVTRDSLTFRAAQKLYLDAKKEDAVQKLGHYVESFPKGYYTSDALFYLSDLYMNMDEPDKALESMRVLASRPLNKFTVPVLKNLAGFAGKRGLYTESATAFRRLYDLEKDEESCREDARGYVEMTLLTRNEEMVLTMVDDAEKMESIPSPALRKARFAKARILTSRGEDELAMEIYTILSSDVMDLVGAESAYRVIVHLYKSGKLDECEKSVYRMADSGTTHNYWLGRSFLILGDVYSSKGDAFQAKATYQSIVDGYSPEDDGVVDEAKDRIKNLR